MSKIHGKLRDLRAFFALLLAMAAAFAVLCFTVGLLSCSPAYACPLLVEVFADPADVSDQEGEFVEVRLDSTVFAKYLWIQFEDKKAVRYPYARGERLVLVHDSLYCPEIAGVLCGVSAVSLPNSRETGWKLWLGNEAVADSGESRRCLDSVWLPRPKVGASLQRVKETDRWEVAEPSFGLVNPYYELGAEAVDPLDSLMNGWGADSSGRSLVISEVHHCPQEPEPEWVEVYNAATLSLPLNRVRFCERGDFWGSVKNGRVDSIAPYESLILTRDTAGLREFLGFREVRLLQVSMGYLNNVAGELSVCLGDRVVDSVYWDKSTVACPLGFSPLTGKAENTPGFLGSECSLNVLSDSASWQELHQKSQQVSQPFAYKLSTRVVRRNSSNLRVLVEGDTDVVMRLLDSAGRILWKRTAPAQSNTWWSVPLEGLPKTGVAYVSLVAGKFEKMVGFVLRP